MSHNHLKGILGSLLAVFLAGFAMATSATNLGMSQEVDGMTVHLGVMPTDRLVAHPELLLKGHPAPPSGKEALMFAGLDILTLANNHSMDCDTGWQRTQAVLEKGGFKVVPPDFSPLQVMLEGIDLSVFAFDDVSQLLDVDAAVDAVAREKETAPIPTIEDFKEAASAAGMELEFQNLDDLATYCLDGIREKRFIIMINVEEAEATLSERAGRYGRNELPIDLASIPAL